MKTECGWSLYARAKQMIPGGTQLLSKRPELFAPDLWPPYAVKAEGCAVEDIDGNRFVDMTTMGIGTCILGYADPVVNQAVIRAVQQGSMCSLNFPEEVQLAELLIELNPWSGMVRFARTGGEALAAAVRIARAASGKTGIAFCGYHGWHDWYLAANLSSGNELDGHLLPGLEPRGVPPQLAGTVFPFHYNRIAELDAIIAAQGKTLGVIIMEPIRYNGPQGAFLEHVRSRADRLGAVLIFDEVTSGWRHTLGGAHRLYGVDPDMAVYAKALGNGYPCAAVVGRRDVMENAQSTFISSSYWTERIGPAAACAALTEFRRRDVPEALRAAGEQVQALWRQSAESAGLSIRIEGLPALCHFEFEEPEPQILNTLLVQDMLAEGYLANNTFYASCAHERGIIAAYGRALHRVFQRLKTTIDTGDPAAALQGSVASKGFTRLT